MGWGDCGTDSKGRPIGYLFVATCDAPGCTAQIDRGLSYACGDMHGEDTFSCENYFCSDHLRNLVRPAPDERCVRICDECAAAALASGYWRENEDGEIVPIPEDQCPASHNRPGA